jgi:hypothetical protein
MSVTRLSIDTKFNVNNYDAPIEMKMEKFKMAIPVSNKQAKSLHYCKIRKRAYA